MKREIKRWVFLKDQTYHFLFVQSNQSIDSIGSIQYINYHSTTPSLHHHHSHHYHSVYHSITVKSLAISIDSITLSITPLPPVVTLSLSLCLSLHHHHSVYHSVHWLHHSVHWLHHSINPIHIKDKKKLQYEAQVSAGVCIQRIMNEQGGEEESEGVCLVLFNYTSKKILTIWKFNQKV